jgi:hypothetical protein
LSKGFFVSPKIIEGAHGFLRVSTNKETSILIELFEKSSKHNNRSLCLPMMARGLMHWSNHLLGKRSPCLPMMARRTMDWSNHLLERGTSLVGEVWLLIAHMLEKLA